MTKTTFSWRNYTRATPNNLLFVAASIRRLVAVVSGCSIIMEASMWVPLGMIIFGALVDEFKNFFAMVVEKQTTQVTITEENNQEKATA